MSKVPMPQAPDDDPLRYVEGYDEAAMQAYGDARAAEAEARKDAAYEERNRVVALLAALLPSVRTRTAIEGWSEDWHGCVYITLPDGSQASWHFHDSQAHLFAHVPEGQATWDGHTTPEKYTRIERCTAARPNIAAAPQPNHQGILNGSPAAQPEPKQTFTRKELIAAIEAERHACSMAVWMTKMDAVDPGADDRGVAGWLEEAEQRIKNRSAADPEVAQQAEPPKEG